MFYNRKQTGATRQGMTFVSLMCAFATVSAASADAPKTGTAPDAPAATAPDTPSATEPAASLKPVTVPLIVAPSGKFCVDTMINGKGPYSLLVDTGSEIMAIKPDVAKACGLTVKTGTAEVQGPTGGFVPVGQADVDTATVAGITMKKPVCLVEPLNASYDGIIGAPLFNAGIVQLDLPGKQLTTYPTDTFMPDPSDAALPILFGQGRVPIVSGTVGGVPASIEIDTGSSFPVELNADFVDTHKLRDTFVKLGTVQHSSVSGVSTSDVYDGGSLKLGDIEWTKLNGKVPALFLSAKPGAPKRAFDGRVGCPLLTDSVMTFDYAHAKVYLKTQPVLPTITL